MTIDNLNGHSEQIIFHDFEVLFEDSFARYGLATVIDRALPDARDGMKPVQRRILWCMLINGFTHDHKYAKSADVVGRVLGDFHPHGDQSVYMAAVRLAQDWVLRYPLIDGQGNWGSIDSDPPAAYRYTEMRLQKLASAHMADIRKDTVPLIQSYKQDPRVLEPLYLPGRIPPVCFPNQGIAVGQTSVVPPHNLGEVLKACIALLDKPDLSLDDLMRYVKGPDFPTGGTIVGQEGIRDYLATGKGQITVRGEVRLEQTPKGQRLVVTEIPFPSTMNPDKAKLVDSIRDAVNDGKIVGIVDLRDESDQDHGVRIVMEIKNEPPAKVLNSLYKHTLLQVNVNAVMTFVFGEPGERARHARQTGLADLLIYWNTHQIDVLTRRSQFELKQAKDRLHVVDGLIIGAAHAEEIVRIFQKAKDRAEAKVTISVKFKLSEIQANVIADMTLSQVTRLNANQYQEEQHALLERIAELEALLADPAKMKSLLKDEMRALSAEFADVRRTRIDGDANKTSEIAEVAEITIAAPIVITISRSGLLKALTPDVYRKTTWTGKDDLPARIIPAASTDFILFPTTEGRIFMLPAGRIPQPTRGQKGEPLRRLLPLAANESVVTVLPIPSFDEPRFLTSFSRKGKAKKTAIAEYRGADATGLLDFKLADGDRVVTALLSDGAGEYLVASESGKILRFADTDLRAMGRSVQGVQAIALEPGSEVCDVLITRPDDDRQLVLLASDGYGKRVRVAEFPAKGRATGGVDAVKLGKNATLSALCWMEAIVDDLLIVSAKAQIDRVPVRDIALQGRPMRGGKVVTLLDLTDRIDAAVRIPDVDTAAPTVAVDAAKFKSAKSDKTIKATKSGPTPASTSSPSPASTTKTRATAPSAVLPVEVPIPLSTAKRRKGGDQPVMPGLELPPAPSGSEKRPTRMKDILPIVPPEEPPAPRRTRTSTVKDAGGPVTPPAPPASSRSKAKTEPAAAEPESPPAAKPRRKLAT